MMVLIIIPAYNEEENIKAVVDKLITEYPQYDYIVVNDGSSDNTANICRENGYQYLDIPINLGLTGAFQTGMRYAYVQEYDYALQYDGDGQHNPEYIIEMLNKMKQEKADIVIGSRYIQDKKSFKARMIGNSIIEGCILLTTHKTIRDCTSGMRLYSKRMISKFANLLNLGPEPDTIAYLIKCGAKVIEVPVTMNNRVAGESYITFTGAVKYMIYMCLSILFVQWFRKKGIL